VEEREASENMKTRLVTRTGFFGHTVQYRKMRFHFRPGSERYCGSERFFSRRNRLPGENDGLATPRGISGTRQNSARSVGVVGPSGLPDVHFSPKKVDLISLEPCTGASRSLHAGSPVHRSPSRMLMLHCTTGSRMVWRGRSRNRQVRASELAADCRQSVSC
jgi:hypothetical protein